MEISLDSHRSHATIVDTKCSITMYLEYGLLVTGGNSTVVFDSTKEALDIIFSSYKSRLSGRWSLRSFFGGPTLPTVCSFSFSASAMVIRLGE
ncbi:hypothetical protein GGP72_002901 [Salinibacter ruber]|uniref:Uncharacterized protein n=1 Tax=Salinibacter ruber TaxID=146919 RepID=A0A9X2TCR4_9BACT|nr:hypothetical protein [Salinibacter ruber]MCS3678675.1 hypothetical protein [Salinibacter ruber]MCS3682241.1 hypothetical protein [Salinibacter ruber]MCS3695344.1 hypothetical protein [Salinibacter ruber]